MTSKPDTRLCVKSLLLHAALLVVILAVFFPGVFFRAETLVPGDLLYDLAPWKYHFDQPVRPDRTVKVFDAVALINKFHWMAADQIRAGYWPLWDPLEHGGLPLLANMQSAVFYPPRLVHVFVEDGPAATTSYLLLKLFLCGMTAYIAAVLLGLPSLAARFVSVAWMLGGFNHLWCYWMEPDVAAWFPLLFLGTEFVLQEKLRKGFMLTSVAGALTLLAGHPETAFSFAFFLGVYTVIRISFEKAPLKRGAKVLSVVGLAWGVALLFCAVQLLPFLEYLGNSAEGAARAHHSGSRLPLRNLSGFWLPLMWDRSTGKDIQFAWTNWLFFGLVSWLALVALAARFPKDRAVRRRTVALMASSLLALLVALNVPGFHLFNKLPLFQAMWYRYNVVFPLFGLCLLAGTGLAQWFSSPPTPQEKARFRTAALAGLVLLLALAWFLYAKVSGAPSELVFYGQVIATALTALVALFLFSRTGRLSRVGLLVVLVVEFLYGFHNYHPTVPRENVYVETRLTDRLQEYPSPARFSFYTGGLLPGLMTYYGLEGLQGYDGLYPMRTYERFRIPGHLDLWTRMEPFCSVPWYLSAEGAPHELWFKHGKPEDTRYVESLDGFDIYENLTAKPRAYLIASYSAVDPHPLAILGALTEPGYDPNSVVLTDAPPKTPSPQPSDGPLGAANVTRRVPDEVDVKVQAKQSCVLVLADNFYPGWQVEVDGEPAELFPAYTVFRGVVIPAGEHKVQFRYAPRSFTLGMTVSVVSLIAGFIAGIATLLRKRRN